MMGAGGKEKANDARRTRQRVYWHSALQFPSSALSPCMSDIESVLELLITLNSATPPVLTGSSSNSTAPRLCSISTSTRSACLEVDEAVGEAVVVEGLVARAALVQVTSLRWA